MWGLSKTQGSVLGAGMVMKGYGLLGLMLWSHIRGSCHGAFLFIPEGPRTQIMADWGPNTKI